MASDEQKINCPQCGESISIDTILTHQIEERIRRDFAVEQKARETELARQKEELQAKELQLSEALKTNEVEINRKVADKLAEEKVVLWKKALFEAEKNKDAELKMLEEQLKDKEQKLSELSSEALKLRLDKQNFEAEKKNFELEKQRQLDEARKSIEEEAGRKAEEAEKYKIAQLEKKISDVSKANDELKRKLEQGSQQTQGEVLELELEEVLRGAFPTDEIMPVPKGVNGADIVQKVYDRSGRLCGQIVWESKKTKNWTEGWVAKLKDDQRAIKAELAVIVSAVLPEDVRGFAARDGVWVCDIKLAVCLASALRLSLESVTRQKAMAVSKDEKMEVIYAYLTGVEFKQRVEAIVEAFTNLKNGLDKEKLAYQKIWAEREKQIDRVVNNTVGLYGDLSGLAPLQQIQILELEEGTQSENV